MSVNSLGDLAQAFALRKRNFELKTDIQRLNHEISTGQTADIVSHLGGSYARLTAVERDARLNAGYAVSIAEADQFVTAMQDRLDQISEITTDFTRDLVSANASQDAVTRRALSDEAEVHFSTIVGALNSQSAGRVLFGGDATDRAALMDADTILQAIDTVLAGSIDANDMQTRLDTWFADPAGFDTVAYNGSADAIDPFKMSETTSVSVAVSATNTEIKDILKSFALAVFSTSGALGLPQTEQADAMRRASEGLLTDHGAFVNMQATLGIAQEQIAKWTVRNQSERVGLEVAKGALLNIDPFRSASELEAAQFQLESLYAVTVRLSQLSLVNFLR